MTPNKSASKRRMCCISYCVFLLKAVGHVYPSGGGYVMDYFSGKEASFLGFNGLRNSAFVGKGELLGKKISGLP